MSNREKTAGKTAMKNNNRRIWHTMTRNGKTHLVAPDGTRYSGTAGEVRDAALMPDRRDSLAQSLRLARDLRREGTLNAEEYRASCEDHRREAIKFGTVELKWAHTVAISAEMLVLLAAGSRLVRGDGETVEDYFAGLFRSKLDALLDVAEEETGKREIPLTRHERAALERIRAIQARQD